MRKKLLAGALAAALLAAGVAAAFSADQSEILVSVSYLAGTFWNGLKSAVKQEVEQDTAEIFSEAAEQAGGSGFFAARTGKNGDIVTGTVGSGLIWTSGSGVVRSGSLVDATVGSEVAAGGTLSTGHRYLAATDVTLSVTSGTAQWMSEGKWTAAGGDPAQQPAGLPFTDVVQGVWYYDDVAYVYQNGLFEGDTLTSFAPEDKMQRCMMGTVLHRMAGKPAVSYSALFQDISDGQWYTAGAIWAGSMDVMTGVDTGRFDPFSNVTRQEIAVILYRYAQRVGRDVSASASLSGFRDAGAVSSWGEQGISWAVASGILNGNDGALLPDGHATRAEVAAMFHRFANWSAKQ